MEQLKNNTVVEAHNIEEPVHECDIVGSSSSSSSSSLSSSSASGISYGSSLEFDAYEEVTSSSASGSASSSSSEQVEDDPLNDMSSLFQQLPIKRGLSKYYEGKSQSFTLLANVRSVEDLPKPENPYNKKLKSCRSCGGGLGESETHREGCTVNNNAMSGHASERGSSSSLSAKRGSANFEGSTSRPPHPSS